MSFIVIVLAIYTGILLSVASVVGFVMFLRQRQLKKAVALHSKPTKGGIK